MEDQDKLRIIRKISEIKYKMWDKLPPTSLPSGELVINTSLESNPSIIFYIPEKSREIEDENGEFGIRKSDTRWEIYSVSTGEVIKESRSYSKFFDGNDWDPGTSELSGSTFTASKTTEPAIDKALEVLKNLHAKGIDEKALASAKNYVKGQFPPNYETTEQLATLLSQIFWYNFDKSFINDFEKNVDGLDLARANQIIVKYFPKDKMQFVLIGKSEDIKKIAEKYGKVTEVEISDDIKK